MLPTINELANEVSRSNIKRERQLLIIKALQDYYTALAKVGVIKGAAAGLKEEDLELPNCKEACPYKEEIVDEAIAAAEKAEEEDGGADEDDNDDTPENEEDGGEDQTASESESENPSEPGQPGNEADENSEDNPGQEEQPSGSELKVEKPLAQMNKADLLSKCKELKIDADENLTNAKLVELIKVKV